MSIYVNILYSLLISLLLISKVFAVNNYSRYTLLTGESCKIKTDTITECQGLDGYRLFIEKKNRRQTITLEKNGQKYPLNYHTTVSANFSHVGTVAEWRFGNKNNKVKPIALIVKFKTSENFHSPKNSISYLVVSKISSDDICVIGKPLAKIKAHRIADNATKMPCL